MIICIMSLAIIASPSFAVSVMTTDGEVYEGDEIVHTKEGITITDSAGKKTQLKYSDIASIKDDKAQSPSAKPSVEKPQNAAKDEDPGYHRHDGFFLRMLGGYGSLNFSESPVYSNGTGTVKASGPAGFFALQLGLALTDNIIIYGALNGYATSNPDYYLNGVKQTTTASNSMGINVYGGGLSLYLDSINAYISGDVGVAKTQITVNNTQYSSDSGIGVNLQIGKEWWVSANWGLGAALFFHYSSMNDVALGNVVPKITNTVIGLAFSATYN